MQQLSKLQLIGCDWDPKAEKSYCCCISFRKALAVFDCCAEWSEPATQWHHLREDELPLVIAESIRGETHKGRNKIIPGRDRRKRMEIPSDSHPRVFFRLISPMKCVRKEKLLSWHFPLERKDDPQVEEGRRPFYSSIQASRMLLLVVLYLHWFTYLQGHFCLPATTFSCIKMKND